MRRSIMILALAAASVLMPHGRAQAEGRYWPWCVYYSAWTYNCGFATYEQCLATAIGNRGLCRPNPLPPPAASQRPRRDGRAR
jgi:hypothetical protein